MSSSRTDWLIFLALGFMWGSSYLFIKIAVDDFGTFTLVALRLAVGSALLWTVLRLVRQPLPRRPRMYGHLAVMALVNIAIPFMLITWAERNVESALAAVLTSLVPLVVAVLAPLFIHDEPLRVNGIVGLVVGFIGVIVLTSREGLDGVVAIVWLGLIGSGFAYLAFFRLLAGWGATRTTLVAYVIPIVGIALGFLVLGEPIDGRMVAGTALVIGGIALVNSPYGRRLVFARARPNAPAVGATAQRS